jgi:hypothetical protein
MLNQAAASRTVSSVEVNESAVILLSAACRIIRTDV